MEPNTAGKNKKIRIKKNNNKINNNTTNFVKSISLPPMYNYKKKLFLGLKLHIYYNITRPFFGFKYALNECRKEKKITTRTRSTLQELSFLIISFSN